MPEFSFSKRLTLLSPPRKWSLWLEGSDLCRAGFSGGKTFLVVWYPDERKLTLNLCPRKTYDLELGRSKGVVSGRWNKPIIIIGGERLLATLGLEKIQINIVSGRITAQGHT